MAVGLGVKVGVGVEDAVRVRVGVRVKVGDGEAVGVAGGRAVPVAVEGGPAAPPQPASAIRERTISAGKRGLSIY
jgi:hypothetical protein